MAAVSTATSSRIEATRHMQPASSSSSPLQRSASASSSATVQPGDTQEDVQEEKASSSSSSSSSPTYQSTSSSNHKTVSTAVSSINTIVSTSPPAPEYAARAAKRHCSMQQGASRADTELASTDSGANHYSYDSSDPLTGSDHAAQRRGGLLNQVDTSIVDRKSKRWEYEPFQDEDGPNSPSVDEETPMQYPPVSEEDMEARAVELNLERWASEERQRRKALRTSRTASTHGMPPGPAKLTKRLSSFSVINGRGNIPPLLHKKSQEETSPVHEASFSRARSTSEVSSTVDDELQESHRRAKGKGREEKDPFRDPSTTSSEVSRRQSVKPTPRAPIVTPGKAPTIRHRAITEAHKSGSSGRMPSIVATDADEEKEAVRHLQELEIDPFQTAAEVDQQRRYIMAREAARRTLLEGDDDAHIPVLSPPPPIMAPIRKSTSSSKFNEIGLDDDGNGVPPWLEDRPLDSQRQGRGEEGQGKRPWWTDWLCGCGDSHDEDNEQSGRTFPE